MNTESSLGIVYVLTNPAMPGLVKIGKTARDQVDTRLAELYSTGVPVPFDCAFAGRVEDESAVERAFHQAFGPYRINPKREFFEIEPDQAIALLRLMIVEDVTPDIRNEADKVDVDSKEASEKLIKRRPRLDFEEMGIPVGSVLQFTQGNASVIVLSNRKVSFDGEETSLSQVTKQLLDNDYYVQPGPYWMFDGKSIRDIYNDTYEAI